mgnify:FL=1
MTFNDRKRLDPSQVQDRRGQGMGKTIAIGGGGLGLIALLVSILLGVDLTGLVPGAEGSASSTYDSYPSDVSDLQTECQTGADAKEREDCRSV